MTGKENAAVTEVVRRDIDGSDTEDEYQNRFAGYQAAHYRVRLKPGHPREFHSEDQVEIQVMSVLQSAWSEVEHNILYKQLKGRPSQPEKSMLDGLNGLVSIGELYLEQLSRIYDERIAHEKHKDEPFANKYELGSFLTSTMRGNRVPADDFTMSSVELLRRFLKLESVNLDSKTRLSDKLQGLDTESISKSSLRPQPSGSQKPNASLVVLERLMQDPDINIDAKVRELKPQSLRKKCKILLSTIISLHELFPPVQFWVDELNKHTKNFDNLDWLMDKQAPRNILLDKGVEIHPQDSATLTELWNWFETHPSPVVTFVFTISKLGVLRDFPQEFDLLSRIHLLSMEYLAV
ncbi:hypothetical protein DIS24_g9881 [Lasiodiplodia hormozganensis]|uniref:RelA/SpoT domain-containing protein n=1 Tax=Lasiodiplodia hormozganensis TaxID=869390 RepID=A0AA40CI37_9PEZI|nr:hypothetical protein DIS24_g9881 [Lasiodiplodia hormozganensis]